MRRRMGTTAAVAVALMAFTLPLAVSGPGHAAEDGTSTAPKSPSADAEPQYRAALAPEERTKVLGSGYRTSGDRAWSTSGDAAGFHVLVAEAKDGYHWRTAASLSEPGFEADAWIGNACVTESGKRAVVAYAPRTFTNDPKLMTRGAFAAVVELDTGEVTKLPAMSSLAYFSPGCGEGEQAVLSQFPDDSMGRNATQLVTVDAATGRAGRPQELKGQVTSAIPYGKRVIVAADGARLVRIDRRGRHEIARTDGIPFQITKDASGGIVYLDRAGEDAKGRPLGRVAHLNAGAVRAPEGDGAEPTTVATGELAGLDVARSASGEVFVTGRATSQGEAPAHVHHPGGLAKDARISTRGRVAVVSNWAPGDGTSYRAEEALTERTVTTDLTGLRTGRTVRLGVLPGAELVAPRKTAAGRDTSPSLSGAALPGKTGQRGQRLLAASPNDPVESERTCSVPRGDVSKQAFQPTPRQVEWAVDQAVISGLDKWIYRDANWKGTGMASYRPQELFPLRVLSGDPNGKVDRDDEWHIPAQILLGVTAQESNMWQATRFAVPGVTANPLIGNYYGVGYTPDGNETDPWLINWAEADCGYGITQVTDGMRLPGRGQPTMNPARQEAVALDYTANIAAGADILAEKWNQTRDAGLVIGDGHAKFLENWFFALWAYNSGFYPEADAPSHHGKWGVGFTNNPANPLWKANRTPFLENEDGGDDYSHAAHPQDWPYQEKVLGWAARPIAALVKPGDMQPGYRQAWWHSHFERTTVKPPESLFCDDSNECDPDLIGPGDKNEPGLGACTREDLHCFWNKETSWKSCVRGECGNAVHRFNNTDYPEQPDENSSYPPRCDDGLPAGTFIVDDLPDRTRPAGSAARSCGAVPSDGTFRFTFTDWNGTYPGKIDTHQIGGGYGGHFWFSHTRNNASTTDIDGQRLYVTGTWTLNRDLAGWTRVLVHMPDHGAHTRQAAYTIHGTDSTSPVRVHPQRTRENRWVDLGVFRFTGTPKVSLSTHALDGDGGEDVAWDAVAFQPLPDKPDDFVVAMGDSYSSGEGASVSGGGDYYTETDVLGSDSRLRNACHRSRHAWSRQAALPGNSTSNGALADAHDASLDYHLVACSGAQTENILSATGTATNAWGERGVNSYGEMPQLDQGYLDQNTTLVTLSIGGNDARFGDVIQACILGGLEACQDGTLDGDDGPLKDVQPVVMREMVRPSITTTLQEIAKKAPNAQIVLMGYPVLLDGGCVPGIGSAERPWINDTTNLMAEVMRGAVGDAREAGVRVWFSDPRTVFAGKGICGDPETIHGIVADRTPGDPPGPTSAQSFHPKISGARLYADALESTLRAIENQ